MEQIVVIVLCRIIVLSWAKLLMGMEHDDVWCIFGDGHGKLSPSGHSPRESRSKDTRSL